MTIDLEHLARFLIKAKVQSYAGDGQELTPQRPDFKELEFSEGNWQYRDSYVGFFCAPGQEIIRFKEIPVWAMAYSGGMLQEYRGNKNFVKQTFSFLKQALKLVEIERPYRGPSQLKEGDWEYRDSSKGNLSDFTGTEHIFFKGKEVFRQNYIGGLIIPK